MDMDYRTSQYPVLLFLATPILMSMSSSTVSQLNSPYLAVFPAQVMIGRGK